jgi:catechol 2,3-dioxygenase-like lactoylglutathione lyase family enzyme
LPPPALPARTEGMDRGTAMIEPKSVVHFSIAVSDLDKSRKFYTEILGPTPVQDLPAAGMVFLRAGSDHVILAKCGALVPRDPKDARRAHHAFKIESDRYDAAKAFLAAKGVDVFEEEDRKTGVFVGRQFYIHDPDGTVIEFSEWDGTSIFD